MPLSALNATTGPGPKIQLMNIPKVACALLVGALTLSSALTVHAQSYTWKPVRIGGGGATIQAHPRVKDLYLITTDVGTPYRWNAAEQRWEGTGANGILAGEIDPSAAAK